MKSQSLPVALLVGCPDLARHLKRVGVQTRSFRTASRAFARGRGIQPRICVLRPAPEDPFADLLSHVERFRREMPFTDVLVWDPSGAPDLVRGVLKAGAADVVWSEDPKPLADTVVRLLGNQQVLPRLMAFDDREPGSWRFEELVSRSQKMWEVFDLCAQAATTDAPVLILGETGTGKEMLARAFHKRSKRRGSFVAVNCAAMPESLIDSELFGHVKGAFTGAEHEKGGLFRAAEGGTLLLDEVGHVPLPVQHRLLRTLQEGSVRPLGGEDERPVDVRVIAATSRNLEAAVESGDFRSDLLYRLDVIRVIIPPLRERPDDVLFLFGYFARKLSEHHSIDRPDVSDGFLDAMMEHDWPGNVRELQNFTERLLLTQRGARRTLVHFRKLMRHYQAQGETATTAAPLAFDPDCIDVDEPLQRVLEAVTERVERAYIEAALRANSGRVGDTADQAGISRRTLLRKMNAFGLEKKEFRS